MSNRTFMSSCLDPSTGTIRDVSIEIGADTVLVKFSKGRARGEDGPHHAAADFTAQRGALLEALTSTAKETDTP